MAVNTFELHAREKKCISMARYILDEAARIVSEQTDDGWRILAKNAELNEPSEQSKQRIVELLKGARLG